MAGAARASAPGADRHGAQAVGDPTQGLVDVVPFDADVGEEGIARDRPGEHPFEVAVGDIAVLEEVEAAERRAVGEPGLADETGRRAGAQRLGLPHGILLQLLRGDSRSERDDERVHRSAAFLRHGSRRRYVQSIRSRLCAHPRPAPRGARALPHACRIGRKDFGDDGSVWLRRGSGLNDVATDQARSQNAPEPAVARPPWLGIGVMHG